MKTYSHCWVLVPCHSLEDFPTHHEGSEAANLLACWTAIWHPALIAASGKPPGWLRAGIDEIEVDDGLVVIPNIARHAVNDSFIASATKHHATLVNYQADGNPANADQSVELTRDSIIRFSIENSPAAAAALKKIDPQIANDFLALGYAYLQVQLMTRQLRYSSNLNTAAFDEHLLAAAVSAAAGNTELANADLTSCFDLLMEEKNNYYPVQPELMDVVLIAQTTLKKSLTLQLEAHRNQSHHSLNFLLTGELANQMALANPAAAARLRELLAGEQASIIGGLQNELPDEMLSTESVIRQLLSGRRTIRELFDCEPTVFFRRRFGLTPTLPGCLDQFNFTGAIHATLDEGRFPVGSSANIRWAGNDALSIPAFGQMPISADDSGAMLRLSLTIGEQIDSAHTATMLFVHWPDRTCDAFDDLIRSTRFGRLFGRFVRCEDYFETVYDPGFGDTFNADDYKSPYLKQSVNGQQLNPISRIVDYWRAHYQLASCRSLLLYTALRSRQQESSLAQKIESPATRKSSLLTEIEDLECDLDQKLESDNPAELETIIQHINVLLLKIEQGWIGASIRVDEASKQSCVFVNTTNAQQSSHYSMASTGQITHRNESVVKFADTGTKQTDWIVDLAGMSHAEVSMVPRNGKDALRGQPAVLNGNSLRNEFFELLVDENTGGIRSIQLYGARQNLVSQQLAVRIPTRNSAGQPLTRARYTTMQVDTITSSASSRIAAAITSTGKLLDNETVIASFQQTVRMARGIPIADIEIEIELHEELNANVNHYFCNRLAWQEETAEVLASFQESRQFISTDWFHATNFIEIKQSAHGLTFFTGGLPHHRRVSRRMIDSLMVVGNEQRRQFRIGLGVDINYPQLAAKQWMTPPIQIKVDSVVSASSSTSALPAQDWLFHFDRKNILVTWWQPIFDPDDNLTGVQVRLRETEGRAGDLTIRSQYPLRSAARVNFADDFLRSLQFETAAPHVATVEFSGNEFFQLLFQFK